VIGVENGERSVETMCRRESGSELGAKPRMKRSKCRINAAKCSWLKEKASHGRIRQRAQEERSNRWGERKQETKQSLHLKSLALMHSLHSIKEPGSTSKRQSKK
jgi:hypothetical protein